MPPLSQASRAPRGKGSRRCDDCAFCTSQRQLQCSEKGEESKVLEDKMEVFPKRRVPVKVRRRGPLQLMIGIVGIASLVQSGFGKQIGTSLSQLQPCKELLPVALADTPHAGEQLIRPNRRCYPRRVSIEASHKVDSEGNGVKPMYTKLFPIYPHEIRKFLNLSFLMFWIVFIFTMTRDTKDALIVPNCGAEAIAFLKVYGVVPAAAAYLALYSKLSRSLDPKALFYATLAPFIVFYFVFAFVLYPLRDFLHPMSLPLPEGGLSYAVNCLRHWTFSLYYIMSELWSSAGLPLLFWTCANDVIEVNQAERIYPLLSAVGNLGPMLSGIAMTLVSELVAKRFLDNHDAAFEVSLKILTGMMVFAGAMVAFFFWNTHRINDLEIAKKEPRGPSLRSGSSTVISKVRTKPIGKSNTEEGKDEPNITDSFKFLKSNRYLRNIAAMVLSYGLTMEFTELIWKATVKRAFPDKTDYLTFMGRYSTLVGACAFVMMFVGSGIVQVMGWQAGALATPILTGLLALPFFACIVFGGVKSKHALSVAVYVGLAQNVLTKATKYSIFDPTKEMTYIPLEDDGKTQGKAAIEVLGARMGKSGGALAQQLLVLICGSIMNGAPAIAVLFYATILVWIVAVNDLAPLFRQKTAERQQRRLQRK